MIDDTILVLAGICPIGMLLQDPVVICRPLVRVCPEQKLMKLLVEVADRACPTSAAPTCLDPSTCEPFWMTLERRLVPPIEFVLPPPPPPAEFALSSSSSWLKTELNDSATAQATILKL